MKRIRLRKMRLQRLIAGLMIIGSLNQLHGGDAPTPGWPPQPWIFPDYTGITLPPNIAPLNFKLAFPVTRARVTIHGPQGDAIQIQARRGEIRIPPGPWQALLSAQKGQAISWDIEYQTTDSPWCSLPTITNQIAAEPIDSHLAYRLLKPLYNYFYDLGVYQRNLENFDETPILQNRSFDRGCLNCHTFLNQDPGHFALQIRHQPSGNPLLLVRDHEAIRVARTSGYLSWHPSGRLLAYSANRLSLFFHTAGECRDVYDAESNLGIYRVDSNTVVIPPMIAKPDRQETWPAWSPDGAWLYFCAGPKMPRERFRDIRYDLMRISYDIATDMWGEPELLVSAEATQLSCAQPRVAPDGQSVLFVMAQYGHFPIYQPSSDLFLWETQTRQYRKTEVNSTAADTWHCWSGNGRWVVFSSKRLDGVFARPHFSYCDAAGHFSKPFVLPQKDPAFYESFIKTYNVPELIRGPVQIPTTQLANAILSKDRLLRPPPADADADNTPSAEQTDEATPAGLPYYRPLK